MQSALQRPEVIREYLARECAEGRVLGPLDQSQFSMVHTSRFGVIPKGSTGKWRLILDLSSPQGHSVNDGIQESLCSLSYVSVDDAVYAVREKGRGALLAKVDIRSAYRIVPVHQEDWWLLGMLWEGAMYIDTALPFGLQSAPKFFNAVADAVEWIAKQQGVGTIMHYLDDFLIVGVPGTGECSAQLMILLSTFDQLSIPVAIEKLEGPATVLTFLGIEMDTTEMVLRLPDQKLQELKQLVASWIGKRSCIKRDLQSLVGKLQHACKVVVPGRTFLRRMFELLSMTAKSQHDGKESAPYTPQPGLSFEFAVVAYFPFVLERGIHDARLTECLTRCAGFYGCVGGDWVWSLVGKELVAAQVGGRDGIWVATDHPKGVTSSAGMYGVGTTLVPEGGVGALR